MGIPWDGTDKYAPWTTLVIGADISALYLIISGSVNFDFVQT